MSPIQQDCVSISLRARLRSSFSYQSCLWRVCTVLLPKAGKWKFLVQNIDWRPMCIYQALPRWQLCQCSAYIGRGCKVPVLGRFSREESMPFRIHQWRISCFWSSRFSSLSILIIHRTQEIPGIREPENSVCGTMWWDAIDGLGKSKKM